MVGIGEGGAEGLLTPFINDLHKKEVGIYMNFLHAFWPLGIVVCVLGGGALMYGGMPWRFVFLCSGMFAWISSILFLGKGKGTAFTEEITGFHTTQILENTYAIFRNPMFWRFFWALFVIAGSEAGLTYWIASYAQLYFHGTAWSGGVATAMLALGMLAGRYVCGIFAKRSRLYSMLIYAGILTLFASLIIPFVRSLTELYFVTAFAGFAIATIWPSLQVCCVTRLPKLDSTLVYVYLSCSGIPGAGIAIWIMGGLGDRLGIERAFYAVPACTVLYLMILLPEIFFRQMQKKHEPAG